MNADMTQLAWVIKRARHDIAQQERLVLRMHHNNASDAFESVWQRLETMVAELDLLRGIQREMLTDWRSIGASQVDVAEPHRRKPIVFVSDKLAQVLNYAGDAYFRRRIRRSRRAWRRPKL